jgi:hypothetical protein
MKAKNSKIEELTIKINILLVLLATLFIAYLFK